MSGDHPFSSLAVNSNTQLSTSLNPSKSAAVPSPVFHTPSQRQGSFSDSGGWTPRFAEDYSVFDTTPSNLQGSDTLSIDRVPVTPELLSTAHKRLISVESVAAEIASHATHFTADPNIPLPPLDPSNRLPSTPRPGSSQPASSATTTQRLQSADQNNESTLRSNRAPLTIEPTNQPITPPPSSSKTGRKSAPRFNMQDEQTYGQSDFSSMSQQQDMSAFIGSQTDVYGYPMSAPATASVNFWDPSAIGMDLDFSVADPNLFQQPVHGHRSMGSFDWSNEPQLFQEPSALPTQLLSNNIDQQPPRRERALAPKPAGSGVPGASSMPMQSFSVTANNSFSPVLGGGEAVNPGLLLSRPQTSAMDMSFNSNESRPASSAGQGLGNGSAGTRQNGTAKVARNGKLPERAYVSSPVRPSTRPGLGRSMSENKGRRAVGRGTLPALAPARPSVATSSSSAIRPTGRTSPFKHQKRLSALASIPEASPQSRQRASVKFTIDARGRARAESTMMTDPLGPGGVSRSQSARGAVGRNTQDSDDDSSETDDEPIIIPSRNTSFNASFALPDPVKPVGSIFHSSKRSISDKSTNASVGPQDGESEAETVMNDEDNNGGDAADELRKVMEGRQRRSLHNSAFRDSSISPTPQKSKWPMEGRGVRCVCNQTRSDESDGYMMQCGSCESWLHGRCINVTRRNVPSVYICPFCSQTPNMRGGRARQSGRSDPLGIGIASSPSLSRSLRSFR